MNTISESLVERYVGFPDTLDAATRAYVKEQIRTDEAIRRVAAFYRDYYEELDLLTTPSRGNEEPDVLLGEAVSWQSAPHQAPRQAPHQAPPRED